MWPEINKDWPLAISDRKTITSSSSNENCYMYHFYITWENGVSFFCCVSRSKETVLGRGTPLHPVKCSIVQERVVLTCINSWELKYEELMIMCMISVRARLRAVGCVSLSL